MSRYINQIPVPAPARAFESFISDYLIREGFRQIDYKGAKVWKKGIGMLTAPQYIGVYYNPDSIRLEAFIKYALFPGVYIGEMGITGFFGFAIKALLKDRVNHIEHNIQYFVQNQAANNNR